LLTSIGQRWIKDNLCWWDICECITSQR